MPGSLILGLRGARPGPGSVGLSVGVGEISRLGLVGPVDLPGPDGPAGPLPPPALGPGV